MDLAACADTISAAAAVALGAVVLSLIVRDQSREIPPPPLHPSDAELKDNLEQVKLLFEYTKFHITVYGTLAAILLTATTSFAKSLNLTRSYLTSAVVAILLAGVAAGVVAASLPELTSRVKFWEHLTGPYKSRLMTIRSWTYVEHTFFWSAVAFVVLAFATAGRVDTSGFEMTISIK